MGMAAAPSGEAPINRGHRSLLILALPALLGIVLSIGGYFAVLALGRVADTNRFEKEAQYLIDHIELQVATTLADLNAVAGLFDASDDVGRREFKAFVNALGDLPQVQALEWVPRVPHADRRELEQSAVRNGIAGFVIRERNKNGEMVAAGEREDYFPVFFAEPLVGNEAAIGFDLASNPARLEALNKARDSGEPVATSRITLVQGSAEQYGLLVFRPVYNTGEPPGTAEERRQALRGMALGVFRMRGLVESVFRQSGTEPIAAIAVLDRSAPAGEQKLYPKGKAGPVPALDGSEIAVSGNLMVGGRQWTILVTPLPTFYAQSPAFWQSWAVLAAGLFLTALLTVIVFQTQRRARLVGRLVDVRTTQLQESESRSHAVIENTVDAIITISDGGIVETYNSAAAKIFGYAPEEVIGRNVSMLMPEPDKSQHDGYLANYLRTGETKIIGIGREVVGRRKDGSTFPLDLSVSEFQTGDGIMFAGLCRDITKRKQAQEELESVNKELESFAYSVSHDLRAPLRGIDGFSQAVVEDYGDSLDEEGKRYLERIRAGAQRMGMLIDDMLLLSRVTRQEMARSEVDISAVCQEIIAGHAEAEPGRRVRFDVPAGLTVHADPRLLRIALENLLGNAWKFTAKAADAKIELGTEGEAGAVVYFVRDNGAGFDMQYADKLFKPFQRLHTEKEFSGTSIGLATVLRIIQRHGGKIWGESVTNEGTTIYFTLGV